MSWSYREFLRSWGTGTYILSSAILGCLSFLAILLVVFHSSFPAARHIGSALLSLHWNPVNQQYGILPMLYGSLSVTALAMSIATPLGAVTALFTSELAGRYRLAIKSVLEILAGIPSIVYGLIAITFVSPWIASGFHLQSGRTFLTAGLVLAIMILPTLITLCDDALHQIPDQYRDNAQGLGLYPFAIHLRVLIPLAAPELIAAILLALGRALGETMAVMLVIGGLDRIPTPWFNLLSTGQTVTSKLGRELAETAFGSLTFSALVSMAAILILIVLLLSIINQRISPPREALHE